jgi:hypothetical protein
MLKYHDIEQNTDLWLEMRAGKLTSSKLGVVMANYGKAFGEPAKKYAVSIAVEQITGKPIESEYSNDHMQRGHEQEPIARELYEMETFSTVNNGGFFCNDSIGCSPDGLVDSGLIEIKSVIASTHFKTIKKQGIDSAYKWQCIGNLMFTGLDWIDYVSYCSTFPEGKQLFVYRGRKEDYQEEFVQINERVEQFLELVFKTKETIINSEYFNQGN